MMRNRIVKPSVFAVAVLLTLQALAIDIGSAKAQGLVGEQPDGYLGMVQNTPDARAVVADINAKRKAHYQRIAAENNIDLGDVERLAGQKAIDKTEPGNFVLTPSGWARK